MTAPSNRAPLTAYACLASSMALVGSYVGLSKLLVVVFPVFLLAWLRFGIAALAMPHWVSRARGEAPLSRHDRMLLFWESFLGNFLFSICMLFGVALSSAVSAGRDGSDTGGGGRARGCSWVSASRAGWLPRLSAPQ
jgi:drug/metabolite transporter (DMT)-like permease